MYVHLARYVQCPPLRVLRFTPCGLSGACEGLCYFMGVCLSPGTRWRKGSGVSEVAGRLPEEGGRSPPLSPCVNGATERPRRFFFWVVEVWDQTGDEGGRSLCRSALVFQ